ncbi:MAG: thioredoxin fold domain-containing protein [Desulfobacteraceae bacterium]
MRMRIWIILFVLMLVVPHLVSADPGTSEKIDWSTYADARNRNDGSRKYFVYLYSDECRYCELMEKKTFTDPGVITYLNTNYTPVRVNTDKELRLAAQFGIQGVPDLRFLSPRGESLARWPGYIESKRLLTLLQYIYTNSYKSVSYGEYVKRNTGNSP